jgi:cytochrome c2
LSVAAIASQSGQSGSAKPHGPRRLCRRRSSASPDRAAGEFGRKTGSAPGYNYSPTLKSVGITWDEQELDKYLANPPADIHGTKMVISVPNAEDRQNVIAYLKTLK